MRYAADFETTVYDGQETTEVWLAGLISEDYKEKCIVRSIDDFILYLSILPYNSTVYFHNEKFDGSFIIDFLIRAGYKKALSCNNTNGIKTYKWVKNSYMPAKSFKCQISDRGVWYSITIKFANKNLVTIRDSLKILPFSLRDATNMLNVKHKKLDMEYKGYRHKNGTVKDNEMEYFEHDLYGLMECLNECWNTIGITKNTIGADCLNEFKSKIQKSEYMELYPNLYDMQIDDVNVGEWIVMAYHGGWVYVNPDKQCKLTTTKGKILDVTSLYPSVMHSKYGVYYPVGKPKYGKGKCIGGCGQYFYQRIKCEFSVKKGKLPFVRIKRSYLYNSRQCLTTSDLICGGQKVRHAVELTMTQTELSLFLEHYDVLDLEYLDYMIFSGRIGMFDDYIDKYKEQKNNAPNMVIRTGAKLRQNNLYGKLAARPDSSFKIPFIDEDKNILRFTLQEEKDAEPGYIAIGAAITSEAMVFNVRHAQMCHDKGIFCYSDTDSIHTDSLDIPEEIPISKDSLCTYKVEGITDMAWYQNAKRYVEVVDGKIEITSAGLPQRGKDLLAISMACKVSEQLDQYIELQQMPKRLTKLEQDFLDTERDFTDFDRGIQIPGKLRPKRLPGGIVLEETTFTIL